MTQEIIVFVYKRKKKFKVLDLDVAKREHSELINDKWIHIATINSATFLQSFLNSTPNERKLIINHLNS